jgi:hypothetical protein
MAEFRRAYPGTGISGCEVHFSATLAPGWYEGPTHVPVFPLAMIGLQIAEVRYANFPVPDGYGVRWPSYIPPDGIAIAISPDVPASNAESARPEPVALRPNDFRRPHESSARTNLYRAGWRFEVQVNVGADGPQSGSVDEANAVLNSIQTTQHMCPCRGRKHSG